MKKLFRKIFNFQSKKTQANKKNRAQLYEEKLDDLIQTKTRRVKRLQDHLELS